MIWMHRDTDFAGQSQTTLSVRTHAQARLVAKVCAWIDLHLSEDIGREQLVSLGVLPAACLQKAVARQLKPKPMVYSRHGRTESR